MDDECVSSPGVYAVQGSSVSSTIDGLFGCIFHYSNGLSQLHAAGMLGPCRQAGCWDMAVQAMRLHACGGGRTDGPLWGRSGCVSTAFGAVAGSNPACVYSVQRSVNPPHPVRCHPVRRQAFARSVISQYGVHTHCGRMDGHLILFCGPAGCAA